MEQTSSRYRDVDTSIDGPHLTVGELAGAFRRGLGGKQRSLEVVLHLSDLCASCWESVIEHARRTPEARGTGDAVDQLTDPLVRATTLALSRLVDAARSGAQGPESFLELRPAHRLAARSCDERLAFFRLVLEELRDVALLGKPREAVRVSQAVFDAIHRRGPGSNAGALTRLGEKLLGFGAKAFRDFMALAHVHLGAAYRAAGDHGLAEQEFDQAAAELRLGGSFDHREIRATLLEHQSDLARVQRQPFRALELVRSARSLLSGPGMEERRAETGVREGMLLIELHEGELAFQTFREALDAIPKDHNPRLRLFSLDHLAAAGVETGRCSQADRYLDQAEPLAKRYPSPVADAHRLWLRGVIRQKTERPKQAEDRLRRAFERLRDLGLLADAVHALASLCELYLAAGRHENLAAAWLDFQDLLRTPEAGKLSEAQLRNLREIVERAGLSEPEAAPAGGHGRNWIN